MQVKCKEDYLIQVKNAMLLHFAHKDICTALRDIDELFASGKEHGKTEAELCHELGRPKDFADHLVDTNDHDRFFFNIVIDISSILAIGIFSVYIFSSLNPVYWGALTIAVSVLIWNLCGGFCLNGFFYDSIHHKKEYIVYCIISFIIAAFQQALTLLLNSWCGTSHFSTPVTYIHIAYYFSVLAAIISGILLLFTIYRFSHGSYFALCMLPVSVGMICSSLSFITYIKAFNGPNIFSSMCSIPYISGFILSFGLLRVFLVNHYTNAKENRGKL